MRPSTRTSLAAALALFLLICSTDAAVYRVGPGQKYCKVSDVSGKLRAGDVVEITGDISDTFTLAASGTQEALVTIRGVTKVENGRIIRPRITPPATPCSNIITCKGDWTVLEGLDISGQVGIAAGQSAVIQACSNLIVRNCRFHHNHRVLWGVQESAGDVLLEFCEFDSNGCEATSLVNILCARPGAKAIVQHCYFHDDTGGGMLRCCIDNLAIRYNWFENPYWFAIKVSTVPTVGTPEREALAEALLPSHCDIVGNVIVMGYGPGQPFWCVSLGGDNKDSPGTEGDFNIAHNLFVTRRGGVAPQLQFVVNGNVDHINLLNNVFLEWGRIGGCNVYERDQKYDTPRTRGFVARRGSEGPIISGAGNWMSEDARGMPDTVDGTLRGVNPLFCDLLSYDFRPLPSSPLAATAFQPLPEGKVGSLVPEFEPQRGIAPDLKPKSRRKLARSSIGPFEVPEKVPAGLAGDDTADLILSVKDSGGRVAWLSAFAAARRRVVEFLAAGRPAEALLFAKMQFLLSPPDDAALNSAIGSVRQALLAVDGNDARAKAFEINARCGMAGPDGRVGTEDDAVDPLRGRGLSALAKPAEEYKALDAMISAKADFCTNRDWLFYLQDRRWYETEKASARLETGAFEEALRILTGVLVETDKEEVGDVEENPRAQRNQDVLDRIAAGLTSVYRARTGWIAGAQEFVQVYVEYAKYGPTGKDAFMGTADDIEVRWGVAEKPLVEAAPSVKEQLAGLKEAGPGDTVVRLPEERLGALANVHAMMTYHFDFLTSELESPFPSGFAFIKPTAREVFEAVRTTLEDAAAATAAGGDAAPVSLLRTAQRAVDDAVITAYERLLSTCPSGQTAQKVRAYLTAYVGAAGKRGSSYPEGVSVLSQRLAGGKAPVFLVEDSLGPLEDPFLAAEFIDALDEVFQARWESKDRHRLLDAVEAHQYGAIASLDGRVSGLRAEEAAPEYRTGVGWCTEFLRRFPGSRCSADVEFQKAVFRYRLGESAETLSDLETFMRMYPDSPLIPNALFTRGLTLLETGDREKAMGSFAAVAQTYPQSALAGRALYMLGNAHIQRQDYQKARECLQQLTDRYPNDEFAGKAREILSSLNRKRQEQ